MQSYYQRKLSSIQKRLISSPFFSLVNIPNKDTHLSTSLKKREKSHPKRFNLHHQKSVQNIVNKSLLALQSHKQLIPRGQILQCPSSRKIVTKPFLDRHKQKIRQFYPKNYSRMVSEERLCSTEASQNSLSDTTPKIKTIKQYKLIRLIGRGKFGQVFLAIHKESNFIGALKIIEKKDILGLSLQIQQKMKQQLINEIKIQSFLNHPNLIRLYDFFYDQERVYLFMELGTDGHLFETLSARGTFSEETTSIVTRQIVKGVQHMHQNNVIHRDIKLENIVFTCGMAKICDFGWSVHAPKDFRSTICGTPLYLPPEIMKGMKYNFKIDIWAIGTLSHQMATGKNPFGIQKEEELKKIVRQKFEMKTGSPDIIDFISFVLSKEPQNRPSAEKLLRHNFLHKYRQIETAEELFGPISATNP